MSFLTLKYPVHTLDNKLLLPEGTVLSTDTLEALALSQKDTSYETHSLLEYGSVKDDLLSFLSKPPYSTIFPDKEHVNSLMDYTKNVSLVLPVLQSLDYFKLYDFHTYRHSLMVFALTSLLCKDILSDYSELIRLASTGPTHDFGKICVPLNILQKTTPLTMSELQVIEHHTLAGYTLLVYYLQDTQIITPVVARDHHERRNGSGYPLGKKLRDRMVEIIAVADIYDALISVRPYQPVAYNNRTALEVITRLAEENEINWDVVQALVAHNRSLKNHYTEVKVSAEKRGSPPPGNIYRVIAEEEDK